MGRSHLKAQAPQRRQLVLVHIHCTDVLRHMPPRHLASVRGRKGRHVILHLRLQRVVRKDLGIPRWKSRPRCRGGTTALGLPPSRRTLARRGACTDHPLGVARVVVGGGPAGAPLRCDHVDEPSAASWLHAVLLWVLRCDRCAKEGKAEWEPLVWFSCMSGD